MTNDIGVIPCTLSVELAVAAHLLTSRLMTAQEDPADTEVGTIHDLMRRNFLLIAAIGVQEGWDTRRCIAARFAHLGFTDQIVNRFFETDPEHRLEPVFVAAMLLYCKEYRFDPRLLFDETLQDRMLKCVVKEEPSPSANIVIVRLLRERGLDPDHCLRQISSLDISVRIENCLRQARITFIGELVQHTAEELLELKHFGKKSLAEINEVLANIGLRLGMNHDDQTLAAAFEALARSQQAT
ncbi:hypothetical protein KBD18_00845 [Patescibacteria group bacterium]|nr:hypothetical protein [Patescibacteria group bacterium]